MSTSTARRGFEKALPFVLFAALFALYVYLFSSVKGTSDDTFIALRYAKNFIEGKGLVFNAGERVEGYSDFLWVMLLSGMMRLGVEPVLSTKVLGFVFGFGTLAFMFGLSRMIYKDEVPAFFHALPAGLLLCYFFFVYWCAQGLESPLFTFLLAGGVYFYLAEYQGGGRLASPVFFALCSLTRPEGPMFFGITLLHRMAVRGPGRRTVMDGLKWAAPFFGILLPYIAWRYSYYGHLVPNTFYAKSETGALQLSAGWNYFKEAVLTLGGAWYLIMALPLIQVFARHRLREFTYLFALAAAGFLYVVYIGGDIQPNKRFFVHFLPVFLFAAYMSVVGGYHLVKGPGWGAPFGRGAGATTLSLAVACLFALMGYGTAKATSSFRHYIPTVESWAEIGRWLKENTPEDTLIAVTNAGMTPYYSERKTIDMLGLNDGFIARNPEYTSGKTAHEKKYNSDYVLSKKPDYIVFRFGAWPRAKNEIDLFNRSGFRDHYRVHNVHLEHGVFALYKRLPDEEAKPTGTGFIRDLGFDYGYKARGALSRLDSYFAVVMARLEGINPNMVDHFLLGRYHMLKKDFARAMEEMKKEAEDNPDFGPAWLCMSICARELGYPLDEVVRLEGEFIKRNGLDLPEYRLYESALIPSF